MALSPGPLGRNDPVLWGTELYTPVGTGRAPKSREANGLARLLSS